MSRKRKKPRDVSVSMHFTEKEYDALMVEVHKFPEISIAEYCKFKVLNPTVTDMRRFIKSAIMEAVGKKPIGDGGIRTWWEDE